MEKYTDRIETFCKSQGIGIPTGFYRHPASRYVAIDLSCTPSKVIAKTWSKQEDVVHYLRTLAAGRPTRILDFKERQELIFNGAHTLERGVAF